MSDEIRRTIRVAIVGAAQTGKSALVKKVSFVSKSELQISAVESEKYVHSVFTESYKPSFPGADHKPISVDGQLYTLDIVKVISPREQHALCQSSEAFVLLYAINNPASLQQARQLHSQIKQAKTSTRFPIFLVGSKADLERDRTVNLDEGRQVAIELRCDKLFEISSKTHTAELNDMFDKLIRELFRLERSTSTRPPMSPSGASQITDTASQFGDGSPRRSNVFDRLKFGSLRRKSSLQSLTRKKSGSFGESVLSVNSVSPSRTEQRSVSYGPPSVASTRPTTSSPFRLEVDTSSWREAVRWPTEIIPEEELKAK